MNINSVLWGTPVKKTMNIFRENVAALLRERGADGATLAFACGHDKSWASKVLTGEREIRMSDIDLVADFFGMSAYQLLQPGVAMLTERRVGERRSGEDRRQPRTGDQRFRSFQRRRPQQPGFMKSRGAEGDGDNGGGQEA